MASIAERCACCGATELEKSPAVLMPFVAKRAFDWDVLEVTAEWGLRDLQPGTAYAVCNSLHCARCELLFLDLRFADEEMGRLYQDYRGESYTRQRDALEPGYAERNKALLQGGGYRDQVEAFLAPLLGEPRRVLDWGGDSGINTPFAGRLEAHHVFDISARPLIDGAQRVDEASLHAEGYDLVVLSQVLEHVPEPLRLLEQVVPVLRADSLLYIEVPFEGLMRKIAAGEAHWRQKRHWHEHVNFFSESSLRSLLARAGLEVEKLGHLEVDVGNGPVQVFACACRARPA